MKILGVIVFAAVIVCAAGAQSHAIPAREAKDHIGESGTVCGKVVGIHYAARSKGQPTFLNFDEPYPREDFTVVVWGSDRDKFGDLSAHQDKRVCVTGKITSFRGEPEIVAKQPSQVESQTSGGTQ